MTDVRLEARWRERWRNAKRKLEFAAIEAERLERETPPRDAYRHALQREILAVVEYTRILRIYTDLVVHGEIPNESDWPRRKRAGEDE